MRARWLTVLLLSSLSALTGCGGPPAASKPAAKSAATAAKDPRETMNEMRRSIEKDVAAGFSTPDQIVQSAIDVFSDEQPESVLRPAARKLLTEALAKHTAAQDTWPAVTDCDRLDKAFADLEGRGIVARQNFSDCGTCGVAEIADEIDNWDGTLRMRIGIKLDWKRRR